MNSCTVGHQLLLVVQIVSQLRTATSRVLQWIRRNTRFRRLQHSKIDKEDFLIGHIDWCIAVDRAIQKVCILSYSKRSCESSAFLIDHSCSNHLSSPSLKKPSAEISRAGWSKGFRIPILYYLHVILYAWSFVSCFYALRKDWEVNVQYWAWNVLQIWEIETIGEGHRE